MLSLFDFKEKAPKIEKPIAKVISGTSEVWNNGKQIFSGDKIIGGHNVCHPLIHVLCNNLGIIEVKPTSSTDECLTIGLSLSLVPAFEKDFRVLGVKDINTEWQRLEFLFKRYLPQLDQDEVSLTNLSKVFKLSRLLGKRLKDNQTYNTDNINDLYSLHIDWYENKEDKLPFLLSIETDASEKLLKPDSTNYQQVKGLIDLINKLIAQLPNYLKN